MRSAMPTDANDFYSGELPLKQRLVCIGKLMDFPLKRKIWSGRRDSNPRPQPWQFARSVFSFFFDFTLKQQKARISAVYLRSGFVSVILPYARI